MDAALREIRVALLEADVHFKVYAKQFIEAVKEKAMGQEVLTAAFRPRSRWSRSSAKKWVKMLGQHQARLRTANEPPSVYMIVGLQGSGKTTSSGKLAKWLVKDGHSPLLVSVDVYRPAARKQLSVIAREVKVPVYEGTPEETKPAELARSARKEATQTGRDILLVDTAGRLHIGDDLRTELTELKTLLNPTEILFVADAMTGQDAVKSADEFHKRLGITGIILTKMDGDARGGAALSIRAVTGQPLKFVGVGEKPDAFEPFHPDRVAQRILGMGDMLSLIEKVSGEIDQKQAEEMQRKLIDDEFTLGDFRDQMKQIRKLGPLESILGMVMPQVGMLKELKNAKVDEKEITRLVAIVDSMTEKERFRKPRLIINGARRRRDRQGLRHIGARGHQYAAEAEYAQARKMMKSFTGVTTGASSASGSGSLNYQWVSDNRTEESIETC